MVTVFSLLTQISHWLASGAVAPGELSYGTDLAPGRERPYNPLLDERRAEAMVAHCTRPTLARLNSQETGAVRPIFIVGLPRSGSTLIEQILASHPEVSPADEVPYLGQVATALKGFPANLPTLEPQHMLAAGQAYRECLVRHAAGRSVVIDKNPHNFWLVGLIEAASPDATVIDARRTPPDALASAFCQVFETGFDHTSSLEHLGRQWRAYDKVMAH